MKAKLKQYWPEISIVVGWIATNFGPQITALLTYEVAQHPHWSTTIAAIALYAARISQPATKS